MVKSAASGEPGEGRDRSWADENLPAVDPVAELAAAWAADATAMAAADPQRAMFDDFAPPPQLLGLFDVSQPAPHATTWSGCDPEFATRPRRSRRPRGVVISDVDRAWLRWLGRYRYASMPQLAEQFGVDARRVRRRVARLEDIGLVTRRAWVANAGSVIVPTAEGIRMALLDLPTPEMTAGTARHELAVVSVGVMWESYGLTVITDREIRASLSPGRPLTDELSTAAGLVGLDAGLRPVFTVFQGSPERARHARALLAAAAAGDPDAARALGGDATNGYRAVRAQWHIPDLVVFRGPLEGRSPAVAVEVELNSKQPADYRRIFAAYADPLCGGGTGSSGLGGFGLVEYFVLSAAQRDGLTRLAERMGLAAAIHVTHLDPKQLPGLPEDVMRRGGDVPIRRPRRNTSSSQAALCD